MLARGKVLSMLDMGGMPTYSEGIMQIRFTPEEEARLVEIATQEGIDPEELVKDAALRLLEGDAQFRAGVRKGLEQADRGEFIEEEEMDVRVKRMFQP
jgi:predicted transcriptional regulator